MNRRHLMSTIGGIVLFQAIPARAWAATGPAVTVHKDPLCGCCNAWVEHLRQSGFDATGHDVRDLWSLKARLGVPDDLASCHTAEVEGYIVEGHVPAEAIERLLALRPDAIGLAVPEMPLGSPGMEVEGMPADVYDVVLFGPAGRTTFARYRGGERLRP